MGTRTYTTPRWLRTTQLSGSVYELNATQGAATDDTTIARYQTGGNTTSRRFRPLSAETANTSVPAVGTAAANVGWREAASQEALNPFTVDAGTWDVRLVCLRSGQLGEVDQNSDVTVIWYRMSAAGAFGEEIGRATVRFTWTTAATERTFTITPPAIAFSANNRVQLEVYVVTLDALNAPAAPATATDLILRINNSGTAARLQAVPTYAINYRQTVSTSGRGVATMSRRVTGFRVFSVTGRGVATFIRKTAKSLATSGRGVASQVRRTRKPLATTGRASATQQRRTLKPLTATGRGVATLATKITAFRVFAATGRGVATLARRIVGFRVFSVTGRGVASAFAKLPFGKVPEGGGGGGTVRRIWSWFSDGDV